MKRTKIAVLTSGGVDSSVALRLLKDQGHDVTAFYLKIWLEDELQFLGDCPWEEDLKYVREICAEINVPLEVIPLQKEYFDTVVKYTIDEVKAGRTPNPDIMCNTNIKFGLFLDKIDSSTYEKIATGHYAQTFEKNGIHYLKTAPDPIKDQTYFLANLKQSQLKKLIFPIGSYTKEQVRDLAEKYDLPNKNRKDSQGICFLGKFKYNEFIKHYLGEETGDILEFETGKKLAQHEGFWYYTIGQRKGIKLAGGPWFVVKKDPQKNLIYVSKEYHSPDKKRNILYVENFNWFAGQAPVKNKLKVKLRHGPNFHDCEVEYETANSLKNNMSSGSSSSSSTPNSFPNRAKLTLKKHDQGIAAGQFAAFYDKDICLGCAVIAEE